MLCRDTAAPCSVAARETDGSTTVRRYRWSGSKRRLPSRHHDGHGAITGQQQRLETWRISLHVSWMVTFRIPVGMPLVEVTAPDGTKSVWAAAVSPRHAVAAVKQLIPADHVAELLDKRVPSDTVPWVRRGDVRRIE